MSFSTFLWGSKISDVEDLCCEADRDWVTAKRGGGKKTQTWKKDGGGWSQKQGGIESLTIKVFSLVLSQYQI